MTPELQAPAATHLDEDTDRLTNRITGEDDLQMLGADPGLATHALDRPARGRMFEAASRAAAAPRASLDLTSAHVEQISALFKLLSDKTRLAILQILCEQEMNVTAMCRELQLPQPTVSHHLGLLRMNRLIVNRRNGKEVFYRLHERLVGPRSPEADSSDGDPSNHQSGLSILDSGFCIQISTPGSVCAS
jgi:DNA-binding transcriptional ArsR family regulator